MLLRLLTFLLLLTLSAPAGVWGTVVHSCDTADNVKRPSCCQPAEHGLSAPAGTAQLTHRCDIQVLALAQQPATVSFKSLTDDHQTVALFIPSVTSIRPERALSLPSSIVRPPFVSGAGPPVFLRTCSFLI